MSDNRDVIILWDEEARKWTDAGKDELLFWSGRLALAVGTVLNCGVKSISDRIMFLVSDR